MKVLLIGSGGREHALAWKLSKSKLCNHLYIAPGNPGTAQYGTNIDLSDTDVPGIVTYCKTKKIDYVVVGPEDPLSLGLVDALEKEKIKAFGPSKEAAAIEANKVFAKEIMHANNIPTAESRCFTDFEEAKMYIASRDTSVVVKAAGLAKGKGVFVCNEPHEGILAAEKIMVDKIFGTAGDQVVVEEKLLGEEASILAFVDGRTIYIMESAQDHKPIGDGDTGPNTGGMGAYCPAPIVTDELMSRISREVLVPLVDGMNRNGTPYKGILYAGIMITASGPKVLEFNCRFGDPETQPILMRFQSDLLEVMLAVTEGKLEDITIKWDPSPAVCVVMSSGGYPNTYAKGKIIRGIPAAEEIPGVKVFHAGTAMKDDQLVTSGGRVLGVTALGKDIREAQAKAYQAAAMIGFDGAYYRKDIANKAL